MASAAGDGGGGAGGGQRPVDGAGGGRKRTAAEAAQAVELDEAQKVAYPAINAPDQLFFTVLPFNRFLFCVVTSSYNV